MGGTGGRTKDEGSGAGMKWMVHLGQCKTELRPALEY